MRAAIALVGLGALSLSAQALSGEWTQDASISVGSYYSDNICLVRDTLDEEGKAAATVTPRVSVSGEGSKIGRAHV